MSWLLFAFSSPVLWVASCTSTSIWWRRHFKQADVGPLMVLTALFALFALPVSTPEVAALDLPAILAHVPAKWDPVRRRRTCASIRIYSALPATRHISAIHYEWEAL